LVKIKSISFESVVDRKTYKNDILILLGGVIKKRKKEFPSRGHTLKK
jgi:hypothetical protein